MRMRFVLLLLSSVMVYGCLGVHEDTVCTRENPCVTVHTINLDSVGQCPSAPDTATPYRAIKVGSRDVVKFVNNTESRVFVRGLRGIGKLVGHSEDREPPVYLSPISVLRLGRKNDKAMGSAERDTLESV